MTSSLISRASAATLLVAGLAVLFAPDVILSWLAPGFPVAAAGLGQLLGAAWIGMAALNWMSRAVMLGGIYGRSIVMANVALYFISALVVLDAARRSSAPAPLLAPGILTVLFAITYGWLLLRGPLARDFDRNPG